MTSFAFFHKWVVRRGLYEFPSEVAADAQDLRERHVFINAFVR